jgi:hypothetical protein
MSVKRTHAQQVYAGYAGRSSSFLTLSYKRIAAGSSIRMLRKERRWTRRRPAARPIRRGLLARGVGRAVPSQARPSIRVPVARIIRCARMATVPPPGRTVTESRRRRAFRTRRLRQARANDPPTVHCAERSSIGRRPTVVTVVISGAIFGQELTIGQHQFVTLLQA